MSKDANGSIRGDLLIWTRCVSCRSRQAQTISLIMILGWTRSASANLPDASLQSDGPDTAFCFQWQRGEQRLWAKLAQRPGQGLCASSWDTTETEDHSPRHQDSMRRTFSYSSSSSMPASKANTNVCRHYVCLCVCVCVSCFLGATPRTSLET